MDLVHEGMGYFSIFEHDTKVNGLNVCHYALSETC